MRAGNWPVALGQVEAVKVLQPGAATFSSNRSSPYTAEIAYSYSVAGNIEGGWDCRSFPKSDEAYEFMRTIKGKPVAVHYNPKKPSISRLLEDAVEMLWQNRPPVPAADSIAVGEPYTRRALIPAWMRPLLPLFIGLSALGLVLSIWVHVGALMGHRAGPELLFIILHCGIFVVWIPAVLMVRNVTGDMNRKDFWKTALAHAPTWIRYLVPILVVYAFINFSVVILGTSRNKAAAGPSEWRGFSGHWMAFYAAALGILYSATRADRNGRQAL